MPVRKPRTETVEVVAEVTAQEVKTVTPKAEPAKAEPVKSAKGITLPNGLVVSQWYYDTYKHELELD